MTLTDRWNTTTARATRLAPTLATLERILATITPDGYPATTPGNGTAGTSNGTISDPTSSAALARTTGTGPGYLVADDASRIGYAIAMMISACNDLEEIAARYITHTADPTRERCNGRIDPTCDNLASEHHHPDHGTTIHGYCDTCWTSGQLCRTCWDRPRDERHTACPACRKRAQRAA